MAITVQIGTEKIGARIYVTGNTFAIKQQLKDAGCHWDGERKQWWIGAAKAAAISQLVAATDGKEVAEDLSRCRVYGKVQYKGRTYYVIAQGQERLRLTVLDGSISFWAAAGECEWVKRYEPRTRFAGYRRGQVTEYQTLGDLQHFVKAQKNPDTRRGECTECGSWGPSGEACSECGGEGHYC